MSKVINMLTNVQTHEVSLVGRGANNKRIAMTKAKDRQMPKAAIAALLTTVLATEAEGESQLISTLKAANTDEESIEVAVANFRIQTGFKDKLSKEQLAQVIKASGLEVAKAGHKEDEEEDPKKPGFFMNGKKMPTAKSAPVDMPVAMQKAFDDQAAKLEKLEKEAEEKDARLEKIEKEAIRKEFVAKCEKNFSHVPGMTVDERGEMLQKAYEVSEDFGKQLEASWGQTQEALKKSALFDTQGVTHSSLDGSSAVGKMEALAKSFMDKDENLSKDQAIVKAMDAQPELYAQYIAENPAQR